MKSTNHFPSKIIEQALYCNYTISNNLLYFILEFKGQLNFACLSEAVQLSLTVVPALGRRFVVNWLKPYWTHRSDTDGICRLVLTNNPEQAINSFTTAQIDPFQDLHLQIRVLRGSSDTVCIRLSHLVTDAAGSKEYLYLLSSIYKHLSTGRTYIAKPSADNDRSTWQISRQFGCMDHLRIVRRAYRDQKVNFLPKIKMPEGTEAAKPEIEFIVKKTSVIQFKKIVDYASINNVTVNDILLTSFCRSFVTIFNHSPEHPICVRIFADLRRHLGLTKKKQICNYSGTVYPHFRISPKEPFIKSVNKVHRKMNALKSDFLGLGDLAIMAIFFKLAPFCLSKKIFTITKEKKMHNAPLPPILTNFGVISKDKADFGNSQVKSITLLPPAIFSPTLTMGFSVYQESLTLSSGFDKNRINGKLMGSFIDTMINNLP